MNLAYLSSLIGIFAASVGAIITIMTFIKAVIEYVKRGSQKRAELFSRIRKDLWTNSVFQKICGSLGDGNIECDELKKIFP